MHIKWTEGRYGILRGSAGDVELFTLSRSTRRDSNEWTLQCNLPTNGGCMVASQTIGMATAEKIFRTFVEQIGAKL